jgi:hypothetical protein
VPVLADLLPDRLSDRDRRALLGRLAELKAIDHLVREVPAQQPPSPPPTLAALSATTGRKES